MVGDLMDWPLRGGRTRILKTGQWLKYEDVYLRTSDHSLNRRRRLELAPDNTPTLARALQLLLLPEAASHLNVDVTGGVPGEPAVRVIFSSSVLPSMARWAQSGFEAPLKLLNESVEDSPSLFGKIYVLDDEARPGGGAASRPVQFTLRSMRNVFEDQVGWDPAEKKPCAQGYSHGMQPFERTFPGISWFAGAPDAGASDAGAVPGAGKSGADAAATQPGGEPPAGAPAGRKCGASAHGGKPQQGTDPERRGQGSTQPGGRGGANQGGNRGGSSGRGENEQRRRSSGGTGGGGGGGGGSGGGRGAGGGGGGGGGGGSSGGRRSSRAKGKISTGDREPADGRSRSRHRRRKRGDDYADSSELSGGSDSDESESAPDDEDTLINSAADPRPCAVPLPPIDEAAHGIDKPRRFDDDTGECSDGDGQGRYRGGSMAKYAVHRESRCAFAAAREAGDDDFAASAVVVQIAGAAPEDEESEESDDESEEVELRGSSTALQRLLQCIDASDRAHIKSDDATLFEGITETKSSFQYSPFFIVSRGRGACAFTGTHAPHVLGAEAAAVPVVILIDREEADAYAAHVQGAERRGTHVLALLNRSGVPRAEGGVNVGHARASAHALAAALRLPRVWLHDDNVAEFKRWSPTAKCWVVDDEAWQRALQVAELTMREGDNASKVALIGFSAQRNQDPRQAPSTESINGFVHKMVLLNVELTWSKPEVRYRSADKLWCGEDVAFCDAVKRVGLRCIKLPQFRWLRTSMLGGIRPALPQKQRRPKRARQDASPSPSPDEAPPPETAPRPAPRPQPAATTPPSAPAARAAAVDDDYDHILALCRDDHRRAGAASRTQRGLPDSLHATGGAGALTVDKADVLSCTELLAHLDIAQKVFLQLLDDGLRDVQKRMRRVLSDIARLVRVARGSRSHDAFKPVHAKQISVCGGVVLQLLRSASGSFFSGFLDALWAPKDEPRGALHLMSVLSQLRGHVAKKVPGRPHATTGAPPTALEAACAALVVRLWLRLDEIDPLKEVERRKEQLRLQNWRP